MPSSAEEPQLPDSRDQVKINISGSMADFIHILIKKITFARLDGDVGRVYHIVSELRENINYHLTPEEKEILDNMELQCSKHSVYWHAYKRSLDMGQEDKNLRKPKAIFDLHVKLYRRQVMDLLKALGYFPAREEAAFNF